MAMNQPIENTYWIAIAHLPRWTIERINRLIVQVVHEKKLAWSDFFDLDKKGWRALFAFSDKELTDMEAAKADLPRLAFIAEQLQSEGFLLIPINSPDYPLVLKENLKVKGSPPVIYIKGRKGLLHEEAVAIVGSRNAGTTALDFTTQVAKKSVKEFKVVVSGFAKGVDKQALDSTIEANGKSIIVLPQGILTFQSGLKKYYEPIVNGDVLVMSTFFPKAGWDVGLAMARNAYIYGLANEIYVAESDSKGGTWEGALGGLKRHRKVYVRHPEPGEKNANLKLIELGGIPINLDCSLLQQRKIAQEIRFEPNLETQMVSEDKVVYEKPHNLEKEIIDLFQNGQYSAVEIINILKLDMASQKLNGLLKKNPRFKAVAGKPIKYGLNDSATLNLFNP